MPCPEVLTCPLCGEPHELSQCPRWRTPARERETRMTIALLFALYGYGIYRLFVWGGNTLAGGWVTR